MQYKTIDDIGSLEGVRVLLRLDLNVPMRNGEVTDDFRIQKALPTLRMLSSRGAKVCVVSHIEGETKTLQPVAQYLNRFLPVMFTEKPIGDGKPTLRNGDILVYENLRQYPGEKANDPEFAQTLARLGDVYINDAFSVSHRAHASVSAVAKLLPSYAGLLFSEEIRQLSQCFVPQHPFLFILGGAKIETKVPLIKKFVGKADSIFVGGALANNFYKEKGYEVGTSLVSEGDYALESLMVTEKILLPTDIVVTGSETRTTMPDQVMPDEKILDAGPETLSMLQKEVKQASFILWNGPLGNYEGGYKGPTLALARMIAESGAKTIVGGGDTLAAIAELGLQDTFSFVSTGGGAMLDFLANETLPGLEALMS